LRLPTWPDPNSTALEFGCSSLRCYRMGSRPRGRAEFGPFRACTRRCGSLVLPELPTWAVGWPTLHNITDRDPDALLLEMGEHHITLATEVEDKAIALRCVSSLVPIGRSGTVSARSVMIPSPEHRLADRQV
jgi:hypothetical protein